MITKITVVTVCYNSSATIKKTIESVLNQSIPPYEHIFIDGDSKDNTLAIINEYRVAYAYKGIDLKVISERDSGIYDAMNKGIHAAEGDMIGILNSDDYYEKDALECLKRAIDEDNNHSDDSTQH